jgi:hypothetical protein
LTQSDKELIAEIAKLREDLKQLREIVNVLVNVVMEEEEEDEQEFQPFSSQGGRLNLYN